MSARPLAIVAGIGNGKGQHHPSYVSFGIRGTNLICIRHGRIDCVSDPYSDHDVTKVMTLNPMSDPSRLFAKSHYRVALIARGADQLNSLAAEINAAGGEVCTHALSALR